MRKCFLSLFACIWLVNGAKMEIDDKKMHIVEEYNVLIIRNNNLSDWFTGKYHLKIHRNQVAAWGKCAVEEDK